MESIRRGIIGCCLVFGSAAVAAQNPPIRVRVTLPAYVTPIAIDTIMQVTEHDVAPGRLFTAVERVFYDIKVSTDTRDSVRGVVGVARYSKSSYLADQPMSRLLNCGIGITGPNADNFRISMALMAIIIPVSATHARLGVGFVGSGVDMRGNSSGPVMCGSTGRLETDFADRVRKILQSP
jgi:hypothetical protein